MLSIKRTKELIGSPNMSDEEAERIRDECRALAEIAFESWRAKRLKDKESKKDNV